MSYSRNYNTKHVLDLEVLVRCLVNHNTTKHVLAVLARCLVNHNIFVTLIHVSMHSIFLSLFLLRNQPLIGKIS